MHANTTARIPPLALVPVPLLFIAAFAAGTALQQLLPLATSPASRALLALLGLWLLDAGGLLALATIGLFLLARTSVLPFDTASSLVTRGPYRFSRNPMYISAVLTYLGAAIHYGQFWSLLLLPLPLLLLVKVVIPYEELRLRQRFGAAYERYCRRVRRWL
jgi:protein-S-isoprenylcysteine O-methyltransferase Ste14